MISNLECPTWQETLNTNVIKKQKKMLKIKIGQKSAGNKIKYICEKLS